MKDTVLEIYDTELNFLDVLPGFSTLTWMTSFQEAGSFDLTLSYTPEVADLLRVNNFIMRSDDDHICQIKRVEISRDVQGNRVAHVTGFDAVKILEQRIVYHTTTHTGDIVTFVKKIVNENVITSGVRGIPIFTQITGSNCGISVTGQVRWDNVYEKVKELLMQAQLGLKAVRVSGGIEIRILPQRDRTIFQSVNDQLIFSDGIGDLSAWNFVQDYDSYKNFAYIAGEADGKQRVTVTIGDKLQGLGRYELYVDARDIQSETESGTPIAQNTYLMMLKQRGFDELAETQITYEFNSETINGVVYSYPEDYQLGDVATVDTGVVNADARISSITEIFDSTGYSVFPTLEIIGLRFVLATEDGADLLTEDGNELTT